MIMHARILIAVILMASATSRHVAAVERPATQPTGAAGDRASARAGVREWLVAVDQADQRAFRSGIHAQTADAKRLTEAMIAATAANKRLKDLVKQRFGNERAEMIYEDVTPQFDELPDEAIKVDGVRAEVAMEDQGPQAVFVLIDGTWKYDIEENTRRNEMSIEDELKQMREITASYDRLAKRIRSGEVTTDEQFLEAYGQHEGEITETTQPADN